MKVAVLAAAAWAVALPALGAPTEARRTELELDSARGAVAYLLNSPGASRGKQKSLSSLAEAFEGDEWNGSLASGIVRSLFFGYRLFLSSQDSASCGFSPSCSRFSQRVIEEHGFFEGMLATMDRLSRDTPLAIPFYPVDVESGLLRDPPEQYCLGCKR